MSILRFPRNRIILIALLLLLIFPQRGGAVQTLLRVAIETTTPPYQFLMDDEPVGVHVDLFNSIAEKNGYVVEYYPMETSGECFAALEKGLVDLVLGAISSEQAPDQGSFTDSLSQSSMCILAEKDTLQLVQSRISNGYFTLVYENETVNYKSLSNLRSTSNVLAANQIEAFDIYLSGRVDVLVGVKNSIVYLLKQNGLDNEHIIINNHIAPINYTIIVKKGNEDLKQQINTTLQKIRISGEYETIHNRWIRDESFYTKVLIRRLLLAAAAILSVSGVILFFHIRLNHLLKQQVEEKTKELKLQVIQTRNTNELKNKVIENSPNGLAVFDRDFSITLINKSACELIGAESDPVGSCAFGFELFHDTMWDIREALLKEEQPHDYKEIKVKSSQGETATYRYNIYQLHNQSGQIRGIILSFDDVTRENAVKDQLYDKQKNRALSRIIAGIAHEVRNPLTSIKAFVEMLPDAKSDSQFQEQMCEIVPREIDRISGLIGNLMNYAKPYSGNKEAILVEEVVHSCTELLKHVLDRENIELEADLQPGLVILADRNQLQQVLINILLNSLDSLSGLAPAAAAPPPQIQVATKASDSYVHIRVADRGCGMTEEQLQKAADPFYTTKPVGTGLGLYLSKQYVEENGGEIAIKSVKNAYTIVLISFRRLS